MTDKIIVWKCETEECFKPCYKCVPDISNNGLNKSCNFEDDIKYQRETNWQPTTAYQITEHKPTQIDASVMGEDKISVMDPDKINVFQCKECPNGPCLFRSMNKSDMKTDCGLDCQKWTICDKYQITERKPTQIDASVMGIKKASTMGYSIEELSKPVTSTPPRKRVKIIWSEVNADNVEMAADLKNIDSCKITTNMEMVGCGSEHIDIKDIPKSWLEDIPAEPMSPQYIAQREISEDAAYSMDIFWYGVRCVQAGEENNELRHAETTSQHDAWKKLTLTAESFLNEDKNESDPDEIRIRYQDLFFTALFDLKIIE